MKTKFFIILTALLMLVGNAQASYYWYVGTTEPTESTNPATEPGWTSLDSKPDKIDVWKESEGWVDVQWYIAAPAEWGFTTTVNGYEVGGWSKTTVTIQGVKYSVWKCQVLTDTANVTLANIGNSNTTYYTLTYFVDGDVYKTYQLAEGDAITPEPEPKKDGYVFSGWSDIPSKMPAHDVTVTGSFTKKEAQTYTLTYMVDGAVYKTYQLTEGTAITPEPAPTKEGYTFSGWSDIPATMPAKDVTISGSFTINKYKLLYMVDGAEYKKYNVEYGATITPEPEPKKDGYVFSGWDNVPKTMPAKDVTVKGTFTKTSTQAKYYWYVGTTEPTASTDPSTESGWTPLNSKPDKIDVWKESEGWVDVQWYIAAPAEWGFTTTVNGYEVGGWTKTTITIQGVKYNVWKCQVLTDTANVTLANIGNSNPTYYTLTYMVDGAVYKTYQLAEGATITPEPEPKKEGYTFSGWDNVPKTMPAKDVTVKGSFTINKYKLKYMVDGAEYKKYDVEYGATITPEPEPKKDGYVFSGWDYVPKTMPAKDVTVTGTFTKKEAKTYTLTYMVDGAVYKTYQVAEGATITPEPEPKKEGYTFSGWDNVPKTMPAKDVTVKGKFTINKYKLKYMVDGAEYKKYDVEYGATITPEPEPKKDGYVFSGWDYVPKTMPAKDVTVNGTFTKDSSKPVDDTVIAKIDWTGQTEYYKDVWYSDQAEVSVKKGKGLIINCTQTNPDKAQYWEPQVPIIANIPQIKKGGRYVVKFDVNAPAAGEIRLDFCSWDGTDASQEWIGTVTAGDNDITASFLNYPKSCTDAFIFYQCGKIPGKHTIKKVQVLQLSDSNYSLTYKVDGIVYKTYILKEGTTITPEPDPKKDGYVFSGWDNVPKTMPAKDVTVNGSFTKSGAAINSVSMDQTDILIFDLQGNRLNYPRKGVNIIRYKDGKTKKVVIR